jgi:hypothetical protein
MAAPFSQACALSRLRFAFLSLRAIALPLRVGLAFAAAHFLYGCALSGLHSQPLIDI